MNKPQKTQSLKIKTILPVVVAGMAGCSAPGFVGSVSSSLSRRRSQTWHRAEQTVPTGAESVDLGVGLVSADGALETSDSFSAFAVAAEKNHLNENSPRTSADIDLFLQQLSQSKSFKIAWASRRKNDSNIEDFAAKVSPYFIGRTEATGNCAPGPFGSYCTSVITTTSIACTNASQCGAPSDTTPPSFENSTPSVSSIGLTGATVNADLDEDGTVYYVVVTDGDTAPSVSQVKNGQNNSGSGALASGSFATSGTTGSSAFSGLSQGTAYDLYVVAQDDEGTPNVQAVVTKVDFITASPDADGTLTTSATVIEPVGLSTTVDTTGEAVDVFDFTLTDGATSDGLSMDISQIVLNVTGTTNDTIRDQITWRLNGNDAANVTGVYNAGSNTITFSSLSISVSDGGSETYTVNAYYNDNTGLTEDQTIILSVDGDTDLTVSGSGTGMAATSAVTNSTGTTVDVTATALAFTTQPAGSTSGSALTTAPVVTAQDAFGNTDVDFTSNITMTETGSGSLSGTSSVAASTGVSTFSNLIYSATADQESFTLTASASGLSDATSSSVTSDVVATQLAFTTQPAPTSVVTGQATAFSTVPVVTAQDADGTTDTGYSTSIELSVTDPNDGTLDGTVNNLSGTGDSDGAGTTVTLAPTSGVATYTGLSLTYTAAGLTDDIALLAQSGGLTNGTSTTITAGTPPTVSDGNISISGASGTGGAFIIGDTVTATWNNTAGGDNNSGISSVTVDFSEFGGGSSVAAVNSSDSWSASYTIVAGAIDSTNLNISVSATSSGGTSTTEDSTNATVDNIAPVVTDGNLSLSGGSGTSGAFLSGDSAMASWNNTGAGDNNSDISSVSFDFTALGGGAAVSASDSSNTWSGTYSITGASTEGFNLNISATVTDDAGNTTSVADTTNATVDVTAPTVTGVTSSTANGSYKAGDSISIQVSFDDSVTVTGTPQLTLETGTTDRVVDYSSGSTSATLTFTYTVQSGDTSSDLAYQSTSALSLNSGTINDANGNAATLTLATPGAANSLSANKALVIDTTLPVLAEVSVTTLTSDTTPDITFSTDEAGTLAVGGSCGSSNEGAISSGNQTITLTDTDNSSALSDGSYTDCTVSVTDAVGNTSSALTLTTFTIDSTMPTLGTNTGFTLNEGASETLTSSQLAASDNISGAGDIRFVLTSVPGNGALSNNGTDLSVTDSFTQADINSSLLTYTQDGSETTTDSFSFDLQDKVGNTNDNSSSHFTVNISVTAVDVAPTITATATDPTFTEGGSAASLFSAANALTKDSGQSFTGFELSVTNVSDTTETLSVDGTDINLIHGESGTTATQSLSYVVAVTGSSATISCSGGTVSESDFNTLVNGITYTNSSDVPTTSVTRVVSISELTDSGSSLGDNANTNSSPGVSSTVTVAGENDAPVLTLGSSSPAFTEGGSAVVLAASATVSDAELDSLNSSNGNYAGASLSIARNGGANTNDSFSFNAANGLSLSGSSLIKNSQSIASFSSTNGTLTITFTDANTEIPTSADVDATLQQLTYANSSDNPASSAQLAWTFSDGTANDTGSVTVSITGENDAPTISGTPATTIAEDSAYSFIPTTEDAENDTLSFSIINKPDWASFSLTTGELSGTPTNADVGTTTGILISVSDGDQSASLSAFNLEVTNVNDAPTISGTPATTVAEDSAYSFTPTANDVDTGDTLSFSIINKPDWASFSLTTGELSGTPTNDDVGTTSGIIIGVTDGDESASLSAFNLAVTNVNDAPTISGTPATTIAEDSAYSFTPTASDVDVGDTLSFSIINKPDWASFSLTTGELSGTPTNADVGTTTGIIISVSDGDESASLAAFDIEVTNVNDAPTISGTPATTINVGVTYSFMPTATDVDTGDTLTFTIANKPDWASFNSATGELSGTPGDADEGTDSNITISVSDGTESVSLASFDITVNESPDSDGDGVSDYQETLDGTDPNDPSDYLDTTAPVVTAPEDIVLDATGLFTAVRLTDLLSLESAASNDQIETALNALAVDNIDGEACCSPQAVGMVANIILLKPGLNSVNWQATDNKGNTGTTQIAQTVRIRPLVSFGKDSITTEGAAPQFKVVLNGAAPDYPFTVPIIVDTDQSTTDTNDHDFTDMLVVFTDDETSKAITVNITEDAVVDNGEVLVLKLDDQTSDDEDLSGGYDPDNINIYDINAGFKSSMRFTIVETNVAPVAVLQLEQAGNTTLIVTPNGGAVSVSANVFDANIGDTFSYEWTSHSALVDVGTDTNDATFEFEPTDLSSGVYWVAVTVTDSGGAQDVTKLNFVVLAALPTLGTEDTDGDGIDDATEGTADSDGDGIVDYLDNITASNVLPEQATVTDSYLVECDPGVRCRLGQFALLGNEGGARLSDEDIEEQEDLVEDEAFEFNGGIFDFEVQDLPIFGQSVRIVLPLTAAIPEDAVYRKYQNGTWRDFVEDANNAVHSAQGNLGYCPPPGDASWQSGLQVGFYCVQLTIEDGGANDADGIANGVVEDPGGVGVRSSIDAIGKGKSGAIGLLAVGALGLLALLRKRRAS